jgi:hypothetical protein
MKKYMLFMLALASCAKVDSQQVKSGGVFAQFDVTGDSSGHAECQAVFQVGDANGTYMALDGGDQVTCEGKSMKKTELLGVITYTADVPYEVGKSYEIVFSRPDESPYKAVVSLPEPVSITWPRAGERVAGSRGVELKWALGATINYDMSVSVSGSNSVAFFSSEYPDKGSRFLDPDSLKMPEGSSAENFTAAVKRARAGSFPTGLAGGRSVGAQQARVTFTLTK